MRKRYAHTLEILRRLHTFIAANWPLLSSLDRERLVRMLAAAIEELEKYAVQQESAKLASREATAVLRDARASLLRQMHAVGAAARFKLDDVPDLGSLRPPSRRASNPQLAVFCLMMIATAAKYQLELIAAGLPVGFIDALRDTVVALKDADSERETHRNDRAAGVNGAAAIAQHARLLVKVIDSLVVPVIARDPARMEEWRRAKRDTPRAKALRLVS